MRWQLLEAKISHFGYHKGQSHLSNINLSLSPGRTVLLGPNGAGKTTLLKLIAGVESFTGSLTLDGQEERSSKSRSRTYRRAVGWLPQEVSPFPSLTAREHVAYVGWLKGMTPRDASVRALDALAQVDLHSKANEKADRLSGGQIRRLGIASVLVHEAEYLLLDEPTAGLDPRERDRLVGVLRSIEETRAVLVSTHDTAGLIDVESTVLLLHRGTLRFAGSYEAFVASQPGDSPDERLQLAYSSYVPED